MIIPTSTAELVYDPIQPEIISWHSVSTRSSFTFIMIWPLTIGKECEFEEDYSNNPRIAMLWIWLELHLNRPETNQNTLTSLEMLLGLAQFTAVSTIVWSGSSWNWMGLVVEFSHWHEESQVEWTRADFNVDPKRFHIGQVESNSSSSFWFSFGFRSEEMSGWQFHRSKTKKSRWLANYNVGGMQWWTGCSVAFNKGPTRVRGSGLTNFANWRRSRNEMMAEGLISDIKSQCVVAACRSED